MDLGVLVGPLDLVTTLLDANVAAGEQAALGLSQRVAL